MDWYKKEARPLPWREEPTPYRVWVSEIMLQQTRIEAAREYFNRFTRAFPTVEALAAAELDDVLKLWEGLGYYSRARNLHKCAKTVCETYGGVFPRTPQRARAARHRGLYRRGDRLDRLWTAGTGGRRKRCCACSRAWSASARHRQRQGEKALPRSAPGYLSNGRMRRFYERALMELGETVCTVGTPSCARCPVAAYCAAHRCGEEALYPVLPEKNRAGSKTGGCCFCSAAICAPCSGVRIRGFASMWELPNDLLPDAPETGEPCGEAVHIFSHVEWHMRGYIVRCREKLPGYVWVTRAEREALAMPTAFRYYRKKLEEMGY